MGCIASKSGVSVRPDYDHSGALRDQNSGKILAVSLRNRPGLSDLEKKKDEVSPGESVGSGKLSTSSLSFRLKNLPKYIKGEQVAAGWPAWLSAVAGEAIQGWVPLKADSFEKLEKIGQGTYSSVFRARDIETGKIVALKKVRFDNFEPESVRFMAREIQILRRLDHPNIVKLEGLITSTLSCSIYLVFEYMEHDLAGLSSCPDIRFSESQVKCYMRQLLSGLQHCHSRGVMHRDIKGSNLLVNNEGIMKIADFGLANILRRGQKQPLTSRVVTLWYRPPELLMGSTDYGVSVDLWSVGCLLAELLVGKPILQGRTEVEQLHKIFKLCGSPTDEYWKKSNLPHSTIFKPHHPYEGCLENMCRALPSSASGLICTLLSVEPYKRGTSSTALASEYFRTIPYACEPSSLPKYPPNKEINAKSREQSRRRRFRACGPGVRHRQERTCKPSRELNVQSNLAARPEESQINTHRDRTSGVKLNPLNKDGETRVFAGLQPMSAIKLTDENSHARDRSKHGIVFSGPLQVPASSGFAWAKRREDISTSISPYSKCSSRGHASSALDPQRILRGRKTFDSKEKENEEVLHDDPSIISKGHQTIKQAMQKQWTQLECEDSFYASDSYHSQELSQTLYLGDEKSSRQGYQDQGDRVEFSGPLLSKSFNVDELLEKHDRQIRQAARRPLFQRGQKQGI